MLVLVALNLAWRTIRYLMSFPMWGDEAFVAINLFDRSFREMMDPLDWNQIVSVGFMWIELAVARTLGMSELALRLAPWLAGVVTMLLFWRLARETLDARSALIAVAMLAAAYYPVRHAEEVKSYSFDLLFAVLITLGAWRLWVRPDSALRWLAMTLLCAVAVWMSYPAVFVAGGALLFLTWRVLRDRSPLFVAGWLLCGVVLAASFVAMYVLVGAGQADAGSHLYTGSTWGKAFPPIREPWKLPWWLLDTHTGNLLAYPVGGKNGGSTFTFLLVVAGCVATWRTRRPLFVLLLGAFVLMLAGALAGKYPYGGSARVSQHVAPAICLLAGAGFVSASARLFKPRGAVLMVRFAPIVFVVIIITGLISDVVHPYKRIADLECRRTLQWLADRTEPGDRWVLFGDFRETGYAPDLSFGWGGSMIRLQYYVRLYADDGAPALWAPRPETVSPDPGGRLWLIAYHDNKADFPADLLDPYLATLRARLGEPSVHAFDLKDRKETMVLYEFGGEAAAGDGDVRVGGDAVREPGP